MDPQIVARRCSLKSPDYSQLTRLDWVVLDFTDGLRTFAQMLDRIPVHGENLADSYERLRTLGFLTWKSGEAFAQNQPVTDTSNNLLALSSPNVSLNSSKCAADNSAAGCHVPTFSGYDDETCANYIPERLFGAFHRFTPVLFDSKLDFPIEMQAFTEFIYDNLALLTPWELLGIPEGTLDKTVIRQAYLARTKQFHPDRYFRKDLGPFATRIVAIFKAISVAFDSLKAQ